MGQGFLPEHNTPVRNVRRRIEIRNRLETRVIIAGQRPKDVVVTIVLSG